jgi:hypothetical protein
MLFYSHSNDNYKFKFFINELDIYLFKKISIYPGTIWIFYQGISSKCPKSNQLLLKIMQSLII